VDIATICLRKGLRSQHKVRGSADLESAETDAMPPHQWADLPEVVPVRVVGCDLASAVQEDGEAMALLVQPTRPGHGQESRRRDLPAVRARPN
jgi:hypothetical protein